VTKPSSLDTFSANGDEWSTSGNTNRGGLLFSINSQPTDLIPELEAIGTVFSLP
jgi:hypothetical protein